MRWPWLLLDRLRALTPPPLLRHSGPILNGSTLHLSLFTLETVIFVWTKTHCLDDALRTFAIVHVQCISVLALCLPFSHLKCIIKPERCRHSKVRPLCVVMGTAAGNLAFFWGGLLTLLCCWGSRPKHQEALPPWQHGGGNAESWVTARGLGRTDEEVRGARRIKKGVKGREGRSVTAKNMGWEERSTGRLSVWTGERWDKAEGGWGRRRRRTRLHIRRALFSSFPRALDQGHVVSSYPKTFCVHLK